MAGRLVGCNCDCTLLVPNHGRGRLQDFKKFHDIPTSPARGLFVDSSWVGGFPGEGSPPSFSPRRPFLLRGAGAEGLNILCGLTIRGLRGVRQEGSSSRIVEEGEFL